MYRAFRLQINETIDPKLVQLGKGIFEGDRVKIKDQLDSYLTGEGAIDAEAVKRDWFHEVKASVFISHSHTDREKAFYLAGYLKYHFNIRAFVDSAIWEDSRELQRAIDNNYSWIDQKKEHYSYDAVCASTSHVHMMLATSIAKMIDQSECFFFLETKASLTSAGAVKQATGSPWIYFELETARSVRIRPKEEHREMVKTAKTENFSSRHLNVVYPVNFERLSLITNATREKWLAGQSTSLTRWHPLDQLYSLIPSEQETRLLNS
jgi:hypothetical protein